MWKSSLGHQLGNSNSLVKQISAENSNDPDAWDTDPDFVNSVSEKEQRWGSKTVAGSGRLDSVNIEQLREQVKNDDNQNKLKELEATNLKYSAGYGGKFGVHTDRVDKSAVGFEYKQESEKHSSQKDYANGFGGKFGITNESKDKSAVGFEHIEPLEKHSSQTDYSKGFGGKYGVSNTLKDKAAVGFDHREDLPKHSSQTDYAKGFGGKFGLEETKMDKCALKFEDQDENSRIVGTNYKPTKVNDLKADIKGMKSRFENNTNNDDAKRRAEEIRLERANKEKLEKELEMEPKSEQIEDEKIQTLKKEFVAQNLKTDDWVQPKNTNSDDEWS